jgi:hypothetical protein
MAGAVELAGTLEEAPAEVDGLEGGDEGNVGYKE